MADNTGPNGRNTGLDDVLNQLEELEKLVKSVDARKAVRKVMGMTRRIPGAQQLGKTIEKYTTRDMAETFVGSIIASVPLLVEDGVFEIASHFAQYRVQGIPVFFVANIVFVIMMTTGLLYWTDFRDVRIHKPLFGFIPRRLLGVLVISFLTVTMLMIMWGRTFEPGLTMFETIARITVIWAAAAVGGALGDILPGPSQGRDISDLVHGAPEAQQ